MGPSGSARLRRAGRALALGGLLLATLTACSSEDMPTFAMPVRDATNQSDRILSLWQGSWIAALAVGAITWGLILWPAIAFRRKRGATDLPPQTRYNLPIEVFYTAVPLIMIAVFFYFTARDEDRIMRVSANPDHQITVTGIQWSWQFTYASDGDSDTTVTGTPGKPPTLYLPQGESVQFTLHSNDVIHSFWVPAFLFKMDVIPGRTNTVRDHARAARHLQGQVRRAVRPGPRPDAVQRQGRDVPRSTTQYVSDLKIRLAQGSAQ